MKKGKHYFRYHCIISWEELTTSTEKETVKREKEKVREKGASVILKNSSANEIRAQIDEEMSFLHLFLFFQPRAAWKFLFFFFSF